MFFHRELLSSSGSSNLAIYRPTGWPWNTNIDNSSDQTWINWIGNQINNGFPDCIQVDGIYNDCLYRATHSSHTYTSVVIAYNDGSLPVSLVQERTYHSWWHNSGSQNQAFLNLITVSEQCVAFKIRPQSGAGGGFNAVHYFTASTDIETLTYECAYQG